MTQDEFEKLKIGQRVINKANGAIYTVIAKSNIFPAKYIAVRSVQVAFAGEWEKDKDPETGKGGNLG